jgi:PII-like signaling protein
MREGLALSVYVGERDRAGRELLTDALTALFTRAGVRAAVLLRGAEGFGVKHVLQTERLLTLSEDLPAVVLAVDEPQRIRALLGDVRAACRHGLITLERVRLLEDGGQLPAAAGEETLKLTVVAQRGARVAGAPAYHAAVRLLHRHGCTGASVLLGVDGCAAGTRQRARFLASNTAVPLLISAIGSRAALAAALPELAALPGSPPMMLERVRVLKRDGMRLADPLPAGGAGAPRPGYWQKLTVQTGEQDRHERRPIHSALVRRLRRAGAAGATAVRAQWGYGGAHLPHGERLWALGRHAPVLTFVLDTPENVGRWFGIVDELTAQTGLVTSELVPALRAAAPGLELGGLDLAEPR